MKCTYGTGAFLLANSGNEGHALFTDSTSAGALNADELQAAAGGLLFTLGWQSGLGSPHWDPHARASITGISRGTTKDHIIRAALESTAYQVKEVIDIMDSQLRLPKRGNRRERVLKVDGGQTRNPFLMQFQADLIDRPIEVSAIDETTALGAAFLAGRAAGIWRSDRELAALWRSARRYEPDMTESARGNLIAGWNEALRRTKTDFRS